MINIRHIPHCYGYYVAMVTKIYLSNYFVLSPIDFIFGTELHWRHIMAARCFFGNPQWYLNYLFS